MLTGVRPFTGTSEQVRVQQRDDQPMPIKVRTANVPDELAAVVMRCLERDPALRYQNGHRLESALGVGKPETLSSIPTGPVKRPPLEASKEKRPAWKPVAAVAAGLALSGWGGFMFAPSNADQVRTRELQRFRQMDWKQVNLDAMPRNCFGFQPCLDRKEALAGSPAQAVR